MKFTLDEVLTVLNTAFGRCGGITSRDCIVWQTVKEELSARPGHKEVFNESGREAARRRKNVKQPITLSGRHSTL